jgi:ADP-ribosylation factor GTPase-activating protein 2/3
LHPTITSDYSSHTPGYKSKSSAKTSSGSSYSSSSSNSKSSSSNQSNDYAQKKFGNKVTSISSDQYFGLDEKRRQEASQTHSARLQQFSGATSISSSQFFGNEQESNNDEDGPDLARIGASIADTTRKVSFPH